MNILLQKGILSAMGLHSIFEPQKTRMNTDKRTRQKICETSLEDIALLAKDYSFDCAVLQVSAQQESFEALRETVRELRAHLPVGILNHSNPSLTNEFLYVANGRKYPVLIQDMQKKNADDELPAFLASLSGAFHGNENLILNLGKGYRLNRVKRQLLDAQGETVKILSNGFEILEYLALGSEKPVLIEDLQRYILDNPDRDVKNEYKSINDHIFNLQKSLQGYPTINILRQNQGVPKHFVCLSKCKRFEDTFKNVMEDLEDKLKEEEGFIIPINQEHNLLRVGGLRFHTAYPMLLVDDAAVSLNRRCWKAMVSIINSGLDIGISQESLNISRHSFTSAKDSNNVLAEIGGAVRVLKSTMGDYKEIIPRNWPKAADKRYKIDSEACKAAEKAYRARMAKQQAHDTDLDTYSP